MLSDLEILIFINFNSNNLPSHMKHCGTTLRTDKRKERKIEKSLFQRKTNVQTKLFQRL
jgi:hypothetical protein